MITIIVGCTVTEKVCSQHFFLYQQNKWKRLFLQNECEKNHKVMTLKLGFQYNVSDFMIFLTPIVRFSHRPRRRCYH